MTGRPPSYEPQKADQILERLERGETLRAICREEGMPARSVVSRWVTDDVDGFADRYARAREAGWHIMAEDTIEIADDSTGDVMDGPNGELRVNSEFIARSRLRVDTRKWFLSKMLPKVYGDRVTQEHVGKDGGPVEVQTVVQYRLPENGRDGE